MAIGLIMNQVILKIGGDQEGWDLFDLRSSDDLVDI